MIDFLSKWIEGIAIAVVITSIFEMIIPNGNLKKYIKVILGIYVVFSIISPFVDQKKIYTFNVSEAVNKYTENNTNTNLSKEINSSKRDLDKIYKNTFEKEIVKTVENEGFVVYKCNVKGVFDAEKENAGISEIKIVLESKKQRKSNNDNVDLKDSLNNAITEDSLIKIEGVEEIQKVNINLQDKKNIYEDNKITPKDIDTLKKYLSKHYEVERNIIDISVR